MSTAKNSGLGNRVIRSLYYLVMTFLGGPTLTLGVLFWSIPALAVVFALTSDPIWQFYFMATSFGVGVYLSQFIGKRYAEFMSSSEDDVSLIESAFFAMTYFSLLTLSGASLGMVAAISGYPQIGLGLAFLVGATDLWLANNRDFSVVTIPFHLAYGLGRMYGWWAEDEYAEETQSEWVVYKSVEWFRETTLFVTGVIENAIARTKRPA